MVKAVNIMKTAAWIAFLAGVSAAQMKYVAVVETELDAQSGASEKMNRAEVRQITAELRSVAVKNLPRDKYNIMTSETVMSQGTARLEECAEENCVIALGSKIGADYIVRGITSVFGTSLTLSVEMYETVDGNLVATSGLIRSENIAELLDKAAEVCAEMYKTFVEAQRSSPKASAAQTDQEETGAVRRRSGHKAAPERKSQTGFTMGYVYSGRADVFQVGFAHARPITDKVVSFVAEANMWGGWYDTKNDKECYGVNIPLLMQFDISVFPLEAGIQLDALYGKDVGVFNAGFVAGAGLSFDKKRARRYYYRFNTGNKYDSHSFGIRQLF